jgi:hypothetical protein
MTDKERKAAARRARVFLNKYVVASPRLLKPTELEMKAFVKRVERFVQRTVIRRALVSGQEYVRPIARDTFDEDVAIAKRALAEGRTDMFSDLRG